MTGGSKTIVLYAPGAWDYFHNCQDIQIDGQMVTFTCSKPSGQRAKQTLHGTWRIEDPDDS